MIMSANKQSNPALDIALDTIRVLGRDGTGSAVNVLAAMGLFFTL